MTTLRIKVRFAHRIPDDLQSTLEIDLGASNFIRRNSTIEFQVYEDVEVEKLITKWVRQTCQVDGDVQEIQVLRLTR